jgi:hypothetical protein
VFSDNKRYLLLLSLRFGAMTKRFFLPTNRRLIFGIALVKYTVIIIHTEISIVLHKLTKYDIKFVLNLRTNTLRWGLQIESAYRKYTTLKKTRRHGILQDERDRKTHFDNSWSDRYTYIVEETQAQKSVSM